jgi:HEAT repeat protein
LRSCALRYNPPPRASRNRQRAEVRHTEADWGEAERRALAGARYADVVPDLVQILKNDKHEYAGRSAAGALSRMGKKAAPALPILEAGLKDPNGNVRNAFEHDIQQIEAAQDEKEDVENVKRQGDLQEGISAFRKALPTTQKK